MGLASSQARLLQLTTRMHQIEYKAAKLEAEKLQMANESKRVYDEYNAALEDTKIQYKTLGKDGALVNNDIRSYEEFLEAGFAIDFRGTVYDGTTSYHSEDGTEAVFSIPTQEEMDAAGFDSGGEPCFKVVIDGITYFSKESGANSYSPSSDTAKFSGVTYTKKTLDYAQLCADAFKADINNPPKDVSEVITNLINSGQVTIVQRRKDNTFAKESDIDFEMFETSVPTNTLLQEVEDETNIRKAEAKYEADMRKIDFKDRMFDRELAAIESERLAIKNEMETLKTVSKDNVERTFKLFG